MKCEECNDEGGWLISVETTVNNFEWIEDGKYMEAIFKECPKCKGPE